MRIARPLGIRVWYLEWKPTSLEFASNKMSFF